MFLFVVRYLTNCNKKMKFKLKDEVKKVNGPINVFKSVTLVEINIV